MRRYFTFRNEFLLWSVFTDYENRARNKARRIKYLSPKNSGLRSKNKSNPRDIIRIDYGINFIQRNKRRNPFQRKLGYSFTDNDRNFWAELQNCFELLYTSEWWQTIKISFIDYKVSWNPFFYIYIFLCSFFFFRWWLKLLKEATKLSFFNFEAFSRHLIFFYSIFLFLYCTLNSEIDHESSILTKI